MEIKKLLNTTNYISIGKTEKGLKNLVRVWAWNRNSLKLIQIIYSSGSTPAAYTIILY